MATVALAKALAELQISPQLGWRRARHISSFEVKGIGHDAIEVEESSLLRRGS